MLLEVWEAYYAGRALGWEMYQAGSPVSGAEYLDFVKGMDFAILPREATYRTTDGSWLIDARNNFV